MKIQKGFLDESFSLSGLENEYREKLADLARPVKLGPGQMLMEAGDPGDGFYTVLEGSLRVSILTADGEEQLLAVIGPGSVVGELAIFDGRPRSATVTAVKDAGLAFISKKAFDDVAYQHPEIYRHMLTIVSSRLRQANDVITARSFLPLPGRVAHTLLNLADSFGKPLDDGRTLIHYKVSQSDIANMAGAARETVSRVLNEWKRSGIISRVSSYYCITNRADLEKFAAL